MDIMGEKMNSGDDDLIGTVVEKMNSISCTILLINIIQNDVKDTLRVGLVCHIVLLLKMYGL